jgi:hypothetical protein
MSLSLLTCLNPISILIAFPVPVTFFEKTCWMIERTLFFDGKSPRAKLSRRWKSSAQRKSMQ